MNTEFILKVKERLDKASWNYERKEILQEAVKTLKEKGLTNEKIRELFRVEMIKEQDNSQMTNNNARYLDLLNEILNS